MKTAIERAAARRVWDSRGRPTIEVEIALANGARGRAIAPAGASTGSGEAVDLRDGGAALGGMDVRKAMAGFSAEIAPALAGLDASDQKAIDRRLIELDGTPNKGRLGGNALIATSMAVAHAAAAGGGLPLWQYLAGGRAPGRVPLPEIQIFGGGAHAGRRIDIQDLMVVAVGAEDFATALDWTAEVYRAAGKLLAEQGKLAGVADEGGFWPVFSSNEEALSTLLGAIERAGFRPGEDMAISLDIAASEFGKNGRYRLDREDRTLSRDEMVDMLLGWCKRYPVVSIEDPLAEDDEEGLIAFTRAAGATMQIIGDDFLVTNAARVRHAATVGACNAVLIKPNQAGTLTETKAALDAAREAGYSAVVSARSGETEDVTVVHLAVGWGVPQLKVGSFTRSERMAKWNEGLRLSEVLPTGGALPSRSSLPWGRP
ncbi:phosphopyruvate hydratase [Mesorhizobium sp. LHD-90]|uniref:phosphopyruvate hydratase n=1 Tax=Mesorhizobium sp. LHD-90 TaxID=3071414 RepID=UPI0027E1224C|nr:phosphopyruvate hydratase [Mesorhizobium sp. LHD-90]MDQ6434838.1 phosphopyruvate hydratase [Mesorhizobium sp. LHD-90]